MIALTLGSLFLVALLFWNRRSEVTFKGMENGTRQFRGACDALSGSTPRLRKGTR